MPLCTGALDAELEAPLSFRVKVFQCRRAETPRRLTRVVVGEEQTSLAGASRKVLVAELQGREVVLPEQKRVAAAVGLGRQRVHNEKIALKDKTLQ